jgi:hypothetical protein
VVPSILSCGASSRKGAVEEWTPSGDELTPPMKLKRNAIAGNLARAHERFA